MATTIIDEAVEHSAAPPAVAAALDQLLEARPDLEERFRQDGPLLDAVVAVTAASRFLTRLLLREPDVVTVLAELDRPVPARADDLPQLQAWKRKELLRVAARDLLGLDPLEAVVAALTELAEGVLQGACTLGSQQGAGHVAVIGMGKLGGRELNYASDVDVMFVGEGDARPVMSAARSCYRVDADLRPEGRSGVLMRTLESYEAYWDRWAQPWEFQALVKARPVAGDADLGKAFAAAAGERVWGRAFGAEDLRQLRSMKARAEKELSRRGVLDREVKRGRGGIRDVEFAVQLLQLVHGGQDAALRSPNTLTALRELGAAGYVDGADAEALERAYRFLRTVEHRLQLVDEQQVHAVPLDSAARTSLARVMGYRDDADATALARFEDDLRCHQATVRSIHERLFFRPLLEAFSGTSPMAPEAVEARLSAFGFAEAERTRQALGELTKGLTRASRLMHQMLPLLLNWLSESPDPDLGLLGLRTLCTGPHRTAHLVTTFRESPEAARRLCLLCGTSRLFITGLEHHPELIAGVGADGSTASGASSQVRETATSVLGAREDAGDRRKGLYRLVQAETLRIAARDVLGLQDLQATAAHLTALAEAILDAALTTLDPPVPMAIVAVGRFGGSELAYASDLDVLIVHDGTEAGDAAAAERTAQELMRFVKGATPAERIYTLDADLRPEGKQGPLARSLDSFEAYYHRWAQTWERQALVRARPVAGDERLGRRFMELVDDFVWGSELTTEEVREIRRMKARVERERIPAGDDPQFHLKLGRGSLSDVEWTAQLLQLRHRVQAQGTMSALGRLNREGVLSDADMSVLADAYRFCDQTRNRWFLVKGGPGDALPSRPRDLDRLARSCDTTAKQLREEYRRVTRRARRVMERLFYGTS